MIQAFRPRPQQHYNALAIDIYAGNASSLCIFLFLIRLHWQAPGRPPHVPPCSTSLCKCIMWVYLEATLKRTFVATTPWVASCRWWRRLSARLCRTSVGMVGMVGNESVTVRLPVNVLPTAANFSVHYLSARIDQPSPQGICTAHPRCLHNSSSHSPTTLLDILSLSDTERRLAHASCGLRKANSPLFLSGRCHQAPVLPFLNNTCLVLLLAISRLKSTTVRPGSVPYISTVCVLHVCFESGFSNSNHRIPFRAFGCVITNRHHIAGI